MYGFGKIGAPIHADERSGFRFDINGLRAWAVLSVIFYHFDVPGFNAGFVGVDVFFVISGFLMASIIVERLESPRGLSIWGFYVARAKRIVPALAVLCMALILLGWFVLPAFEYGALGVQVISALAFFSNIKFWRETNYFSDSSQDQWLLHTWSLSVEWQFYLLLPVLLLCVWRLMPSRRSLFITLCVLLWLSLVLSLLYSERNPTFAFYLLPTRAWEMLAGSTIYFLASYIALRPLMRYTIELLGLIFIALAIVIFNTNTIWPGWSALLPVAGASLVILAARQQSMWTGTRIAQWLGNCSYSLYLWHWPVVVVLVYANLKGQWLATLIGLILTFLLGWVSYQYVEQRIRLRMVRLGNMSSAALIAIFILLITIPCLLIKLQGGLPGRIDPRIDAVYNEAANKNPRIVECFSVNDKPVPECTYGGDTLGVIVIGDSHAASIMRSVEQALPDKRLHVLDWSLNSCPTVINIKSTEDGARCGSFVAHAVAKQKNLPENVPVIILNRNSLYTMGPNEPAEQDKLIAPPYYFSEPFTSRSDAYQAALEEGIINTACALAAERPVYMLRPVPEMKYSVPKTMGRALMFGQNQQVSISWGEYMDRNRVAWQTQDRAAERCGVKILDPTAYLCADAICSGSQEGLPLYYDDDHLSERGANLLIPMFQSMFKHVAAEH